jgi:hypothetical protein
MFADQYFAAKVLTRVAEPRRCAKNKNALLTITAYHSFDDKLR